FLVQLEGAEALGLDDHNTVLADALVRQRHKPLLVKRRQAGMQDIETQMHRRGHLVDVLATGTLGANLGNLDLPVGQLDRIRNLQHRWLSTSENPGSSIP